MKSVFITGGGGYIGGECAVTLARAGYAVAVCDINEEAIARTVKRIEDEGGKARGYVGDVTNSKNIEDVMRRAVSELGKLHAMIHVAGGSARIAGGDVKRVSWFVAHYTDQTPDADRTQVLGVLVLPIEAALKTLTYGSTREILREVDKRLGAA